jgi:hypothetical protein
MEVSHSGCTGERVQEWQMVEIAKSLVATGVNYIYGRLERVCENMDQLSRAAALVNGRGDYRYGDFERGPREYVSTMRYVVSGSKTFVVAVVFSDGQGTSHRRIGCQAASQS